MRARRAAMRFTFKLITLLWDKSKSKSKCYPSYRVWAGAFRPSRRSVAAGQQPVSFDWSWDSHLLWTPQSQTELIITTADIDTHTGLRHAC